MSKKMKTIATFVLCFAMIMTSIMPAFDTAWAAGTEALKKQTQTETEVTDKIPNNDKSENKSEVTDSNNLQETPNTDNKTPKKTDNGKLNDPKKSKVKAPKKQNKEAETISNPLVYFGISFKGVSGETVSEVKNQINAEFPDNVIKTTNQVKPTSWIVLGYQLPEGKKGQSFSNKLPDIFTFTDDTDFNLIIGGTKVGTIHLDAGTKTLTTTLSADVSPSEYVLKIKTPMGVHGANEVGKQSISMDTKNGQDAFTMYYVNSGDAKLKHEVSFDRTNDIVNTVIDVNKDYSVTEAPLKIKIENSTSNLDNPEVVIESYDKTVDSGNTNVTNLSSNEYSFSNGTVIIKNPQKDKQYKVKLKYPIAKKETKTFEQKVSLGNELISTKSVKINYDDAKYAANSQLLTLKKIPGSSFTGWELEIDGHTQNDTIPIDTITFTVDTKDTDTKNAIKGNKINFNNFGQVTYSKDLNSNYEHPKNNKLDTSKKITDIFNITQSEDENGIVTVTLKLKNPADAHNDYKIEFNTRKSVPGNTIAVKVEADPTANIVKDSVSLQLQRAKKQLKETVFENGRPKANVYTINIIPKKDHLIQDLYIEEFPKTALVKEMKPEYITGVSGVGYKVKPDKSKPNDEFATPTITEKKNLSTNDISLQGNKLHLDNYVLLNTKDNESKFSVELTIPIDDSQIPATADAFTTANEVTYDFMEMPQNMDGNEGHIARFKLDRKSDGERPILTDKGMTAKKWSFVAKNDSASDMNQSQILNMIVSNANGKKFNKISFDDTTTDSYIVPKSAKIITLDSEDVLSDDHGLKSWKNQSFDTLDKLYKDNKAVSVNAQISNKNLKYTYNVPNDEKGKVVVLLYKTETKDKWYNANTINNHAKITFDDGGEGNVAEVSANTRYGFNQNIISKKNTNAANDTKAIQHWEVTVDPGIHFSENKKMINPIIKDTLSQPEKDVLVNTFIKDTLKVVDKKANTEYVKGKDYEVTFGSHDFVITFKNNKNIVDPIVITMDSKSSKSNTVTNKAVVDDFNGLKKEKADPNAQNPEDNKQIPISARTATANKVVSFTEGGTEGKIYLTNLYIKKTDQFKNPLSKVKFIVTNAANEGQTYRLETGEDGIAVQKQIPVGTYHIIEDASSVKKPFIANTKISDIKLSRMADSDNPTQNEIKTNTAEVVNKQTCNTDITVKKVLDGKKLKENQFTFELKDDSGKTVAEASNKEDGTVVFKSGKLTYDNIGEYKYTVSEKQDNKVHGVKYDTATKNIKVKVELNDKKEITAKQVTPLDNAIFTNVFKPVTVQIKAKKVLSGRDLRKGDFTFELKNSKGDVVTEAKNDADGDITFESEKLKYDDIGTYDYTVSEKQNNKIPGITYDSSEKKVQVKVEVNDKNELLAKQITDLNDVTFENSFKPVTVQIKAKKILEGRDLKDREFTFVLKDHEKKIISETKNDADGTVTFDSDELSFIKPGVYTYSIEEKSDDKKEPGVTYDTDKRSVYVHVTVDEDNQLQATISVSEKNKEDVLSEKDLTFTNIFKSGAVDIKAQKKLKGRKLKLGEFSFILTDSKGNEIAKSTNDGKGNIIFKSDKLKFDVTGEYTYYIREDVSKKEKGMTYDKEKKKVVVKVSLDKSNQFVVTQVQVPKFENKYKKPKKTTDNTINSNTTNKPKTGDPSNIAGLVGVLLVSLTALVLITVVRRKRKND